MTAERSDLSLLFDLFTVNQRTRRALEITMRDSPLPPLEYAIYSLIMAEGPNTPTAFAERAGMPVTTFLDYLRDMDERNHIIKSPNPSDGRSYLVGLSAEGRVAQRESVRYFDQTMGRILRSLPIAESEARRALGALLEAADATLAELEGRAD